MQFRLFLTTILTISFLALTAQDARPFSMEEAVSYALENSFAVKNAAVEIADARQQILEQQATGLPKINAQVDYQYAIQLPVSVIPATFIDPNADPNELAELQFGTKQNLTTRIDLNTMIFDFTYFTGLKAAREFKKQKETNMAAERFNVRYEVMEAYLPSLIIEENMEVLDKNIANVSKLYNETKALYDEGFVEQLDVDRLELSMLNLQSERENLERQKELAYNGLKFAMGFPISEQIVCTDDIDDLFTTAEKLDLEGKYSYESRPAYRSLLMARYLNELNIQVKKSRYFPSLNGFLSYQYVGQGDQFDQNTIWNPASQAGISLRVPIFDGLGRKASVSRAKLNLDLIDNQVRQFEQAIDLEIVNARKNYNNALERLEDRKRNVRLAEKIYETAQIKYREGMGSTIELSQSEQSLYSAQQNFIQSKYELLTAKLMLDKALGK